MLHSSAAAALRPVRDIEEVLSWAFRDELPKTQERDESFVPAAPSISPMFRLAALGCSVDNWSREPGFPAALGPCHPDALRIRSAVEAIGPGDINIAGYAREHGLDPVGVDVDMIAATVTSEGYVPGLIVQRARLGKRPVLSPITVEPVRGPTGKFQTFVEETGELRGHEVKRVVPVDMSKGSKRAPWGSFGRITYLPGRVTVYTERAEYAAWRAGLELLAGVLRNELSSCRPSAPAAALRPWLGDRDIGTTGKVLPSLKPARVGAVLPKRLTAATA